ncbi:hypothetical protein Taro_011890 [Colocasia esculenta]|uniref:AP2/ERF domain-containing protein n=1 Tax=Colocasia esculenta TaxID=4460 RepID=A0A843UBD0_COLES|nr:hypothetical protein [Colocasia esculenta]
MRTSRISRRDYFPGDSKIKISKILTYLISLLSSGHPPSPSALFFLKDRRVRSTAAEAQGKEAHFKGARKRPWERFTAEIRDPSTKTWKWPGTFDMAAEKAARAYDEADGVWRVGERPLAGGELAIGFANITGYSVCGQTFDANRKSLLGLTLQCAILLLLYICVPIFVRPSGVDRSTLFIPPLQTEPRLRRRRKAHRKATSLLA